MCLKQLHKFRQSAGTGISSSNRGRTTPGRSKSNRRAARTRSSSCTRRRSVVAAARARRECSQITKTTKTRRPDVRRTIAHLKPLSPCLLQSRRSASASAFVCVPSYFLHDTRGSYDAARCTVRGATFTFQCKLHNPTPREEVIELSRRRQLSAFR